MTGEEKKRLLTEIEKQYKWLMTKSPTIYMMDIAFDAIRKAVRDEASKELEEPTISLDTYKQVAKERDIAIEQLHELGYEFGEKIPTTQERQAESDRFDAAFQDGYNNGYAQARFDYEQEPITKNDLAVDCISRQAVIDVITANCIWENEYNLTSSRIKKAVENLPSVTPLEPKTGHWINYDCDEDKYDKIKCSECGHIFIVDSYHWCDIGFTKDDLKYCPNCGAKMVEEPTNGISAHDLVQEILKNNGVVDL